MASSIPGAIDWLVGNVRTAVTAVNAKALVFDGFPDSDADDIVLVGLDNEDGTIRGNREPVSFDATGESDAYEIPMYLRSHRGGTDQSGARTAVFGMFDAIADLIDGNRTAGGAVFDLQITGFDFKQTGSKQDAGGGRTGKVYFSVRVEGFV